MNRLSPHKDSSRFSNTLSRSKTVGSEIYVDARLRDFRLRQVEQIDFSRRRRAAIRTRLPVTTSIIVVFAGAIRTDDAAQLAGVDLERQRVQRLESRRS